jgi:cell division protein FtsI/penicillin-binding protein 2
MALAYGAIANDGVLMRPRVVRWIRRPDGAWAERPVRAVGRVIPASVARRVRRVLCCVVEEGTGKRARLEAYSIGGKTGTAQKPAPGGGFSHTAVICSFVGMAPIEAPRLVVIVAVDEPTKHEGGRHFGGTVAAPVVGRILHQSLAYLGVTPDKPHVLARLGLGDGRTRATR